MHCLLGLEPGDGRDALLCFIFNACAGGFFILLLSVGETLFLARYTGILFGATGAAALPVLYIASAVVSVALGALRLRLGNRLSVAGLLYSGIAFQIAGTAAFYLALTAGLDQDVFAGLIVWIELVYFLVPFHAELLVVRSMDVRRARRVAPVAAAGTSLAYVVGSLMFSGLAGQVNIIQLLPLALTLGFGSAFVAAALVARHRAAFRDHAVSPARARATGPVLALPLVRLLLLFVAGYFALYYLVEYTFKLALQARFDEVELAHFIGLFNGAVAVTRIALQMFGAGHLLRRFGLGIACASLPLALAVLGGLALMLGPAVFFLLLVPMKAVDNVLRYGIVDTALPVLYQALPERQRGAAQAWVSGVVWPLVAVGSGCALQAVAVVHQGESTPILLASVTLVALFLAPLALRLGAAYRKEIHARAAGPLAAIGEDLRPELQDRRGKSAALERMAADLRRWRTALAGWREPRLDAAFVAAISRVDGARIVQLSFGPDADAAVAAARAWRRGRAGRCLAVEALEMVSSPETRHLAREIEMEILKIHRADAALATSSEDERATVVALWETRYDHPWLARVAVALATSRGIDIPTAEGDPDMLSLLERVGLLARAPVFAEVSEEFLAAIAALARTESYAAGEVVFRAGETGHDLYVVASGRVRVSVHGREVAILGPGECLGEMAVFDGEARSATAEMVDAGGLLTLSAEAADAAMRAQPEIALGVIRVLSSRLRAMNPVVPDAGR